MSHTCQIDVIMMLHNHVQWADMAIKSVLEQDNSPTYRLLIADDASVDGSSAIAEKWANLFPERVIHVRHSQNKGYTRNLQWALKQCKAPFLAFCDADDCWLDSQKLQKQWWAMQANPEVAVHFHAVLEEPNPGRQHSYQLTEDCMDRFLWPYLLEYGNPIATSSSFFRNKGLHLPDALLSLPFADLWLYLQAGQWGSFAKSSHCMALFRTHTGYFSPADYESKMIMVNRFWWLLTQALITGRLQSFFRHPQDVKAIIQHQAKQEKKWISSHLQRHGWRKTAKALAVWKKESSFMARWLSLLKAMYN